MPIEDYIAKMLEEYGGYIYMGKSVFYNILGDAGYTVGDLEQAEKSDMFEWHNFDFTVSIQLNTCQRIVRAE